MTRLRMLAVAGGLLFMACSPPLVADSGERNWYVAAGGGVLHFEGGDNTGQAAVTLGRKLPYRHQQTPRSNIALELEVTRTTSAVSRRIDGERRDVDVTTGSGWMALNTYVGERFFHRTRLGLLYRHLDPEGRSSRSQGRIGFGMGAGFVLTPRLEVLADASVQYWGTADLAAAGTVAGRFYF